MVNNCVECMELQQTLGISNTENSTEKNRNKYRNYVLIGCGVIVGSITGSIFPFISPAFRKFCLPYVPATDNQVRNVFHILKQFERRGSLVDLGSGDGRIVIEASRRSFQAFGVELNYSLVLFSRIQSLFSKSSAKFYRKDLWKFDLRPYDNIVIFGVESMMSRLEKKILDEVDADCKIVACRFPLPTLTPIAAIGEGIDTVWIYKKP